jgi:ubiquinone/menaquinone biosynthesis C-methylase UbiE
LGNLHDKNLLIIGTGASRLAFDVHQRLNPSETIAVDINPVLLGVAQKIKTGESVDLYEVPLNPGHMENVAVLRKLSSDFVKQNKFQNLHFLFADGLAVPLKPKSIDALLTPWFIDIVPEDFALLARRMNRFLKSGGTWVNFGPLGFSNPQRPTAYTFEEIKELLEDAGFALEQQVVREVPYLQSPLDIQKRTEKTHSFCVKKIKDVKEPPAHQSLPQWLLKTDLPIPLVPRLVQQGQQSRLHAEILNALDGKRTLGDLQQLAAQHYQITPEQALNLLIQILTPYMEES